jgi:hypothetical protein
MATIDDLRASVIGAGLVAASRVLESTERVTLSAADLAALVNAAATALASAMATEPAPPKPSEK